MTFGGCFGAYQRKTRARDGGLEGPAFGWLGLASKEVQVRVKMAVLGQFGVGWLGWSKVRVQLGRVLKG